MSNIIETLKRTPKAMAGGILGLGTRVGYSLYSAQDLNDGLRKISVNVGAFIANSLVSSYKGVVGEEEQNKVKKELEDYINNHMDEYTLNFEKQIIGNLDKKIYDIIEGVLNGETGYMSKLNNLQQGRPIIFFKDAFGKAGNEICNPNNADVRSKIQFEPYCAHVIDTENEKISKLGLNELNKILNIAKSFGYNNKEELTDILVDDKNIIIPRNIDKIIKPEKKIFSTGKSNDSINSKLDLLQSENPETIEKIGINVDIYAGLTEISKAGIKYINSEFNDIELEFELAQTMEVYENAIDKNVDNSEHMIITSSCFPHKNFAIKGIINSLSKYITKENINDLKNYVLENFKQNADYILRASDGGLTYTDINEVAEKSLNLIQVFNGDYALRKIKNLNKNDFYNNDFDSVSAFFFGDNENYILKKINPAAFEIEDFKNYEKTNKSIINSLIETAKYFSNEYILELSYKIENTSLIYFNETIRNKEGKNILLEYDSTGANRLNSHILENLIEIYNYNKLVEKNGKLDISKNNKEDLKTSINILSQMYDQYKKVLPREKANKKLIEESEGLKTLFTKTSYNNLNSKKELKKYIDGYYGRIIELTPKKSPKEIIIPEPIFF